MIFRAVQAARQTASRSSLLVLAWLLSAPFTPGCSSSGGGASGSAGGSPFPGAGGSTASGGSLVAPASGGSLGSAAGSLATSSGGADSTSLGGSVASLGGSGGSTSGGVGNGGTVGSGGTSTVNPSGGSSQGGTGAAGAGTGFHVPFEWNGIIGNGQSLSVGSRGTPVLTTKQPFNNVKLYDATGKYALDSSGTLSLVPLVEPIRPLCSITSNPYPCSIYGETPHTALSIQLTTIAKAEGAADYLTIQSVVGQGAAPLSVITKGGTGNAYAAGLSEAHSFKKMADAAGKKFGYVAVVFTHGESDNGFAGSYESNLYKLYQGYGADLPAITGQSEAIPLIASQQVSSPPTGNGLTNTPLGGTALALWQGSLDHPAQIVCSGPKYQYRYYSTGGTNTDPHFYAAGYRRLGEKYAEIIDAIADRGAAWRPLQPSSAALAGTSLTVDFQVPNPPLAWEPSLSISTTVDAWKNGRGFEVVDSTGPVTIVSATISGQSVVVTLAAAPTGSKVRVRYATYNGCSTNCGNRLVGQLRDSDPFLGADVETISCSVTQGSTSIECTGANSLATREWHDIVTGTGLADDTVVVTTDKATKATLSNPWTGSSGTAQLKFAYDLRNYAVQFDLAVPYTASHLNGP
jgi:hypothetical protein